VDLLLSALLPAMKTGGARSIFQTVFGPLQPGGLAASPGDVGRCAGMQALIGDCWIVSPDAKHAESVARGMLNASALRKFTFYLFFGYFQIAETAH
jgi:hypothetical protein